VLDIMKFDPLEIKFKPNFMLYPSIVVLLKFYLPNLRRYACLSKLFCQIFFYWSRFVSIGFL